MAQIPLPPPIVRIGPLRWMRENLFNTWYNALITLGVAWLLWVILSGLVQWAVVYAVWTGGPEACQAAKEASLAEGRPLGACWTVIPANLRLLLIGTYPGEQVKAAWGDQVWRVWASLYLVLGLLGLSAGLWRGVVREAAAVLGGAFFLFTLLFGGETRAWLAGALAVGTLGFSIGVGAVRRKRTRILTRGLWVAWVLSFPLVIVLLGGLGTPWLPSVPTTQWGGLMLTVLLAVVGIAASFPLGVLLALGRRSRLPLIRAFSIAYIEVIRGVPLVTILFMASVMLPIILPSDWRLDKVVRAMLGITLFSAAYMAENVRGGLQAIPRGQYEAAMALGLSGLHTTVLIILPQALRLVIPAIVGQFISLFKDTSLVTIVGLLELLGIARSVLSNPDWLGLAREVLLFVAITYWIFTYSMAYASRRLERTLGVGQR